MKYKDVIVLVFLSAILIYAVCSRYNLVGKGSADIQAGPEATLTTWGEPVNHRDIEIKTDTVFGLTVTKAGGETVAGWTQFKSVSVMVREGLMWDDHTVDIVFGRLSGSDSIPCFLISENGSNKTFDF